MRKTCTTLLATGACLLALPGAAFAGKAPPPPGPIIPAAITAEGQYCPAVTLSQPLTGFGDWRYYTLAPSGSVEDGPSGWSLAGGSSVSTENEPWRVRSSSDSQSLVVPAGGSATTAPFCVDSTYPTFRFFARAPGGAGHLKVEVLAADPRQRTGKGLGGDIASGRTAAWRLTDDMLLSPDVTAVDFAPRQVVLKFSSDPKGGTWKVDDIYVDPRFS
jgi:hypothetical protein